jgi:hypothetical protein
MTIYNKAHRAQVRKFSPVWEVEELCLLLLCLLGDLDPELEEEDLLLPLYDDRDLDRDLERGIYDNQKTTLTEVGRTYVQNG